MQGEDSSLRLRALQLLLALDAVVLFLFGALFITMPVEVETAFHFTGLPRGVSYLVGLWGCVFVSLAMGYAIAATAPLRNVTWVQAGIVRGALECAFGFICIARGIVDWQQAGTGIIVAAIITVAYLALYPRTGD